MVAERRPKQRTFDENQLKKRRQSEHSTSKINNNSRAEEENEAISSAPIITIASDTASLTITTVVVEAERYLKEDAHQLDLAVHLSMPSDREEGSTGGHKALTASGADSQSPPSSATSSASSLSSMTSYLSEAQVMQAEGGDVGDTMPPVAGLQLPQEVSLLEEPIIVDEEPPLNQLCNDSSISIANADPSTDDFSPVLHMPNLSELNNGGASAGLSPVVSPGLTGLMERVIETRVNPRTAKELEMVDETPACLMAPQLQPGHPRTRPCHMSCGRAGRAKAFRGPTEERRGVVTLYGEDAVVAGELTLPVMPMADTQLAQVGVEEGGDGRWARILAVLDGHGLMGKDAARVAAEKLLVESDRTAPELVAALLRHDVSHVKAMEHAKYSMVDNHLEETLRSPTGGTTCSSVQLVRAQSRLFMVVSNVGDSPVLLINNHTKHVKVISGRHSWDNPEERLKYLERCSSLGLPAREVVYGRINCGGMRMEDLRGGMDEPFLMYKPGTAVIDPHSRDHLCKQVEKRYKNSIGGSQSIRRFVMEKRTFSGGWEAAHAMIEHGHVNWGATILVNREGKIQMSRSLGDLHEKQTAYIWSEPDVSMYEFSPGEDATVLVCSDGISDLWYFHELGELAADFFMRQPDGDAQELANQILELTLDRGAKTPGYGIGPRNGGPLRKDDPVRRPGWDDVALQVIHLRCPPGEDVLPMPPPPPLGGILLQVGGSASSGGEGQYHVEPPAIPMEEGAGSV